MKRTAPAPQKTDRINIFLPFQKLDDEQHQVWGRATEELVDLDDEVITYACAEKAFDEWNDYFKKATGGKSQGNVREMHEPVVAGHVIATVKNPDEKAIDLGLAITDDDAWKKCKSGDYIGLSIGGQPKKSHVERRGNKRVNVIDELKMIEVSLVDHPANPAALFSVVKRAEPSGEDLGKATAEDVVRALAEAFAASAKTLKSKPAGATRTHELAKVLKTAFEKQLAGPRSEIASILPAVEALRSLCFAMDSEFLEMVLGEGADERGDIAVLTAAVEATLEFIYSEFQEQIRSLTGAEGEIMSNASSALDKFLTLTKTLTPAQLQKVMSDADLQASVKAMHAMGHAMVKATYAMGVQDCKVADPHAVEGDETQPAPAADDQAGQPAADAGDKKPAPDPEKKPDPAAAADDGKKPEDTKGATPEHREDLNAVKPVPKDTPGNTGVVKPGANSDVERPSTAEQERDSKKSAEAEGLLKVLTEIADELKVIPDLMKSVDSRVKRIEKAPAPIGRTAAPAEKHLPGSTTTTEATDPDAVHKAVVAEIRKAAEAETDPAVRQALSLRAATLAVKKVHTTGPTAP